MTETDAVAVLFDWAEASAPADISSLASSSRDATRALIKWSQNNPHAVETLAKLWAALATSQTLRERRYQARRDLALHELTRAATMARG
jgi:hypothetical protein